MTGYCQGQLRLSPSGNLRGTGRTTLKIAPLTVGQESWVIYSLILYWFSSHHLLYTSKLHLQAAAEPLQNLGRKSWATEKVLSPCGSGLLPQDGAVHHHHAGVKWVKNMWHQVPRASTARMFTRLSRNKNKLWPLATIYSVSLMAPAASYSDPLAGSPQGAWAKTNAFWEFKALIPCIKVL